MSEAIISRRGYTANGKPEFRTEYITGNTNWKVPDGIKSNITVRIIGGGGVGNTYGVGGGSGWMNNGEFQIAGGTSVPITIGRGATWRNTDRNSTGGTTSFGTYLSANGGSWSDGGAGGGQDVGFYSRNGGKGYQFGGGGSQNAHGGDGGMWGGGGGSGSGPNHNRAGVQCGGNGGTYGGGGGGGGYTDRNYRGGNGGNGGEYGGGGGGGGASSYRYYGKPGTGGTYGGDGGVNAENGNSGVNTIGNTEVPENLRGAGSGGRYTGSNGGGGGGGGFGGNGGWATFTPTSSWDYGGGGGGGGYGGNGGNSSTRGGGGGGGYGGDGGNANLGDMGGGGGGYGKGADGSNWGGGGGYYCPAGGYNAYINRSNEIGRAGGGIGIWENNQLVASYGSGRVGTDGNAYGDEGGVCILQYYV